MFQARHAGVDRRLPLHRVPGAQGLQTHLSAALLLRQPTGAATPAEVPEAHLQLGGGLRDDGWYQQDGRRDRAAPPATPATEDCSAAAAAADAAQDNG